MKTSITRTLNTIRQSVPLSPQSGPSGYECAYCQLGFDGDRLNCPACGGPVHERT